MQDIKLFVAYARLNDAVALDTMIGPIHNGEQLRAILKPGWTGRTQGYHQETQAARYIVCDGEIAMCCTLNGVSLEQAAEVAAECDDIKEWSASAFMDVASRVLGNLHLAQ